MLPFMYIKFRSYYFLFPRRPSLRRFKKVLFGLSSFIKFETLDILEITLMSRDGNMVILINNCNFTLKVY